MVRHLLTQQVFLVLMSGAALAESMITGRNNHDHRSAPNEWAPTGRFTKRYVKPSREYGNEKQDLLGRFSGSSCRAPHGPDPDYRHE